MLAGLNFAMAHFLIIMNGSVSCRFLRIRNVHKIGPLQLAIHVAQNRRAREQQSHWDMTNKENYNLK